VKTNAVRGRKREAQPFFFQRAKGKEEKRKGGGNEWKATTKKERADTSPGATVAKRKTKKKKKKKKKGGGIACHPPSTKRKKKCTPIPKGRGKGKKKKKGGEGERGPTGFDRKGKTKCRPFHEKRKKREKSHPHRRNAAGGKKKQSGKEPIYNKREEEIIKKKRGEWFPPDLHCGEGKKDGNIGLLVSSSAEKGGEKEKKKKEKKPSYEELPRKKEKKKTHATQSPLPPFEGGKPEKGGKKRKHEDYAEEGGTGRDRSAYPKREGEEKSYRQLPLGGEGKGGDGTSLSGLKEVKRKKRGKGRGNDYLAANSEKKRIGSLFLIPRKAKRKEERHRHATVGTREQKTPPAPGREKGKRGR